jgi:arylsulfatase A-like enzyme
MPTFADIIQTEKPAQTNGISFLPTLLNKAQEKHAFLNWELQLSGWFQIISNGGFRQAARMDKWKAVRYGIDSDIELYDLSKDESESKDIAADHPAIVQQFDEIFENERDNTVGFPYGGVKQDYKSQDKYTIKSGSYEKIN